MTNGEILLGKNIENRGATFGMGLNTAKCNIIILLWSVAPLPGPIPKLQQNSKIIERVQRRPSL